MNRRPKIVVDENIPFIKGILEPYACVEYLSPEQMTAVAVSDADCLVVRTRTHCDAALLEGSRVKLIATATIGIDHIDLGYCTRKGIRWMNVPGCNAMSVGQYVGAALCYWSKHAKRPLKGVKLGIVGVGHVGKAVAMVANCLEVDVLLNDPPRERVEGGKDFRELAELAMECDVISFHTPLTIGGENKTCHLANAEFFASLRKSPLIINAARGGVVDEAALLDAMDSGWVSGAVIDCWEGEPELNKNLMRRSLIATPHIAGYSADGKAFATERCVKNVSDFFHLGLNNFRVDLPMKRVIKKADLEQTLPKIYDIKADSDRLKQSPMLFEQQRSNYPIRRECIIDETLPL